MCACVTVDDNSIVLLSHFQRTIDVYDLLQTSITDCWFILRIFLEEKKNDLLVVCHSGRIAYSVHRWRRVRFRFSRAGYSFAFRSDDTIARVPYSVYGPAYFKKHPCDVVGSICLARTIHPVALCPRISSERRHLTRARASEITN